MGGQPGHVMLRGRLRTTTGRRGPKTTWGQLGRTWRAARAEHAVAVTALLWGDPFPIRPPKYPALDTTGVWAQISGVSASGNDVTFTFKAPDVPFAATIAQVPIVPEHVWSKIANPTTFADTNPVGTGPFMLSSFAPTQYTLKKNPQYWNAAKIAPSSVVFPAQATNQSTNQLEVSSGQWTRWPIPSRRPVRAARLTAGAVNEKD
jgi:ABC-type transport system substrate-binding protein